MKKIVVIPCALLIIFCMSSLTYAHYDGYSTNIKEGFIEMARSPLVLVDELKNEYKESEFKPFGVFGGILKGGFYALKEVSSGLFRVLTFSVEDDNYFVNKFGK